MSGTSAKMLSSKVHIKKGQGLNKIINTVTFNDKLFKGFNSAKFSMGMRGEEGRGRVRGGGGSRKGEDKSKDSLFARLCANAQRPTANK